MTVPEIMAELQANSSESIKKILLKHGVMEPLFGVKVEFLKTIKKKIKKDYVLAKALYATGNADAMYLAGLIADDEQMTKADLETWVKQAFSCNIGGYTVPWVTAGGKYGYELGLEWITSKEEHIAAAGWAVLSNWVALKNDTDLNLAALKDLLANVVSNIQTSPDRIRPAMNNFVIALGTYVAPLTDAAIAASGKIGTLTIVKEGTACKVPNAAEYINKAAAKGSIGKKKKTVKC